VIMAESSNVNPFRGERRSACSCLSTRIVRTAAYRDRRRVELGAELLPVRAPKR
jgi:hypothetical protein